MKKLKRALITVITVLILVAIILPKISNAADLNPKLYFGVNETKLNDTLKFGYAIGNPTGTGNGSKIWSIVKYSNNSYTDPTDTSDIYCIRAGYGFTSSDGNSMDRKREYTNYFDMVSEKDQITDAQVTALKTRTAQVNGENINSYNAVLALADLFYIPGVSDASYKDQLLENANDKYDNYKVYDLDNSQIQAIQQAALWFFTNSDDSVYTNNYGDPYTKNGWLYYTQNGTNYDMMDNYNPTSEALAQNYEGVKINQQAVVLYDYLISEAAERVKSGSYNSPLTKVTLYTNLTTNKEQPLIKIEKIGQFDLKLIKRITEVNGVAVNNRITSVDVTKLANGTATTADYKMVKEPVSVKDGDIVTYTIRVYNEGDIDGYAKEITDDIPSGLQFLTAETSTTEDERAAATYNSTTMRWVSYEGTDGKTYIKTDYLAKEQETTAGANLLKAFDPSKAYSDTASNKNPDYREVTVKLKVVAKDTTKDVIRNEAAITQATDSNGNKITDRDSNPEKWGKENSDKYYDDNNKWPVYKEDDEDYDNITLKRFDLALRKYITKVDGEELENTRTPDPDETTIDTTGTATYKHRKDPVSVKTGSIVTYNLTIYNEGNIAGRATKITDQLPTGLKYSKLNTSGYTAEYNEEENKLILTKTGSNNIPAYNGTKLLSETVEIECEVVSTKTNEVFTNVAWISEEIDENNVVITNQKGEDRDSEPSTAPNVNKDNMADYKGNGNKSDLTDKNNYYKGQQDDDDFEKVIIQGRFDLKLIKRIAEVNGKATENRIKSVDITNLANGTATTADYKMEKNPISVKKGDFIKYTIRVYNEGDTDGYAAEITDDLPDGLEFLGRTLDTDESKLSQEEKDAIEYNLNMNWTLFKNSEGKNCIKTDYLAKGKGEELTTDGANLIKAFDSEAAYSDTENSKNPDYKEVSVILRVVSENSNNNMIRNEATISQDTDSNGNPIEDRDSKPEDWEKENSDKYYDDDDKWPVYKEDDEDYDNIILQQFDLALRKFITNISGEDVTSRIPKVGYDKENNKITYTHPKTPLDVVTGDIVTYTIRVFNEGTVDGYAKEIMDDMPDGLQFIPDNETNREYRWVMYREVSKDESLNENAKTITRGGKTYTETNNLSEANVIVTDYLSKEQEKSEGSNLLVAFDSSKEISDTNPSYKDVKVAFKIVEPNGSDKILVNSAQISDDSDKDGNPVDDIDSKPGEWNEGEDDQDKEYVKLTYFDLALRKWVTESIVIENGTETVTKTGNTAEMDPEPPAKVELHRKKLDQVTVKFRFSIRITNEGDIEGYAKEITDYIPEGLKFVAEDNPGWTDEGNNVISTRLLENRLLKPGESAEISVLLTWINGKDNVGLKTNTAEISEDYNEKHVPDRDSTPDNKKPGEDDIDTAPVILSISTGQERIYYLLGFIVLITVAGGVVLIKKFVL